MLVKMLQFHSDKPALWIYAAKWEFEKTHKAINARKFLSRGLIFNPNSELLYTEVISFTYLF